MTCVFHPKWIHSFSRLERETSIGTFSTYIAEPVTVRRWAAVQAPPTGIDHFQGQRFETQYDAARAVDAWLVEQGID